MVGDSIQIPQKRGDGAELFTLSIATIFLFIGTYFSDEKDKFYAFGLNITIYPLLIMFTEILHRLCLICEEIHHIPSRYTKMTDIFKHAFQFSPIFLTVFIILLFPLFYITLRWGNPIKCVHALGWPSTFCLLGAILFITLLKPKYGPLYQAISIDNLNGLDYGSAMAYSFFHGYLQIVLPDKGTEQKGIKELMKDFEAKHGIEFEYDRLLVLIPLSLYCPPNMEKSSTIELAQSLQEITIDRAGVNKRSYKSTAYKIKTKNNRKIYVCVEYATPLRTLYEIIKHHNEHARDYELQQKELVLHFYLTLQNILSNDRDCEDCCDLIFFDDKNENGNYIDVGEVVLAHIEKKGKGKNKIV